MTSSFIENPFIPHLVLLGAACLGEAGVAIGILKEYTWPLDRKHKKTAYLVVGGVVFGFISTFLLFLFDEAISNAQLDKISTLEERLAARSLSNEGIEKLSTSLSKFPGQSFKCVAYWDDKESADIADQIASALIEAKWNLDPSSKHILLSGVIAGIVVYVDDGISSTAIAAKALVDTLNSYNIPTTLRIVQSKEPPSPTINVTVGIKP